MRFRFLSFVLVDRFGKIIKISRDFEDLINSAEFIVDVISVS
jgi:hypothetical protein